jgi:hypothetical protein
LLRLKAIEKMDSLEKNEFYSFTVVFSTEESVRKQARELFLKYLEEVQTLVQRSSEKDVYRINFDLFKWS